MIDVLNEYIFIVSVEGKIVECNQRGLIKLGYTKTEIKQASVRDIIYEGIESIGDIITSKKKHIKSKVKFKNKNRKYIEEEAILGYICYKKMECSYIVLEKMRFRDEKDLYNTNKPLMRTPKLLENMAWEVMNEVDAKAIGVYLYSPQRKELDLQIAIGLKPEFVSLIKSIDLDESLMGTCFKTKKRIERKCICELKHTSIKEMLRGDNINYIEYYPIIFEDEILGVLNVAYENKIEEQAGKDEEHFITLTAAQIGIVIKNMMLYEQVGKEFEKRIIAEEDRALFFNTTTELIGIIDCNGVVKEMGDECTKVLGWSKKEIQAEHILRFVHSEDLKAIKESIELARSNERVVESTVRCLAKRGHYRWISWKYRYIKERRVFICSGRDITEDRKREEENHRLEEIIALEEIKSEFFTNMSHEFKTPLNIILSTLQLIDENREETSEHTNAGGLEKYMKFIRQNAYRLVRLVNNIIDTTRIDAGYYPLQLENHNIINVIEEITLSIAQYAESKGINLIFDTDIEERIMACDAEQIERIMLNLLSNAIKYTDELGEIKVQVSDKDKYIEVSVKDNGVGMDKKQLSNIFERFIQADIPYERRKEGSGIGLALVKSIVEMHEGEINVASKIGEGTEFVFRVPVKYLETAKQSMKYEGYSIKENKHHQKCNIEFYNFLV